MDANPGYILNNLGFQEKSECVPLMIGAYEMIYSNWTSQENGFQPKINWTMASRPKIIKKKKAVSKVRHNEPVGRVISLPDAIEQWINHPVWYPIMSRIKFYNKECLFGNTPIMLGLKRAGVSWNYLRYHMKERKYIFSGDWSQYDQRVNSYLFENAIRAISYLFDHEDVNTHNYIQNWIKFVREQVMNGTYIIDKSKVLERVGGVPSGSLLTSLIDSITNFNVIYEIMRVMDYKDTEFEIGVYGDDHYVLFDDLKGMTPPMFKKKFSDIAAALFNFKSSPEDTVICETENMEVEYKKPIYDEPWYELMEGTSEKKPIGYQYSSQIFRIHNLMKGETHRQNYYFTGKPSFLSYYWRDDGMPIRPLIECMARILNPEKPIQTIEEYEALIWSWIYENIYNYHFVNDMYYILMDIEWMKEEAKIWGGIENVTLCDKDSDYYKFYYSQPNKLIGTTQRMWFRRRTDINQQIDIRKHSKWIDDFTKKFEERYYKLNKIYLKCLCRNEHYDTRNQMYNYINNHRNIAKYKKILDTNDIYDPVSTLMKTTDEMLCNYDDLPTIVRDNQDPFKAPTIRFVRRKALSAGYLNILLCGVNSGLANLNRCIAEFRENEVNPLLNNEFNEWNKDLTMSIKFNYNHANDIYLEKIFLEIIKWDELKFPMIIKLKKIKEKLTFNDSCSISKYDSYKNKGINNDLVLAIMGTDNDYFENYDYGKNEIPFDIK